MQRRRIGEKIDGPERLWPSGETLVLRQSVPRKTESRRTQALLLLLWETDEHEVRSNSLYRNVTYRLSYAVLKLRGLAGIC
jgi:hypothetical protein